MCVELVEVLRRHQIKAVVRGCILSEGELSAHQMRCLCSTCVSRLGVYGEGGVVKHAVREAHPPA